MSSIIFIAVFTALLGGALWKLYLQDAVKNTVKQPENKIFIIAALAAGLIAHIICAVAYKGHSTDMGCFSGWSDRIYKDGFAAFYASDGFHDYPPGYVYIMWVLGAFKHIFKLQDGASLWLLLKTPAIIADLVMGWLVYKIALKKFNCDVASVFAAIVVLNPALIVDSASWGQIDSILALFCVLAVYFTAERKFIPAYFAFAAGVLIKPQAAFFAPVIIFGLIDELFIKEKFSFDRLLKQVGWAAAAVAAMFILFMPFGDTPINGIRLILDQYIKTLGEYPYMTINAFNIYAAAGNNWEKLNGMASWFGYGMMIMVVLYAAYVFFKSKNPSRHYIAAFIISFGIYIFGVKMHERYAFPGIFMLVFALITMPTLKNFMMYGLFSVISFFQFAWVLFIYNQDINKYYRTVTVINTSLITIAIFVMSVCFIQKEYVGYREEHEPLSKTIVSKTTVSKGRTS
ncbi:MAG: DUF2029 domain-containing protein [Oscillospiraceae bacterium]|nr:DUF2029 domain-containing protein [Oscillospiraceae bacterium]